jgi:hypothetical protein
MVEISQQQYYEMFEAIPWSWKCEDEQSAELGAVSVRPRD